MNNKQIILTENQILTLEVALRYCEKNHPYYKGEFRKLLNEISKQIIEVGLFNYGNLGTKAL